MPSKSEDEFRAKFFATRNHFEKVQVCIREQRYLVWNRLDKPNLNDEEYLTPVLGLPVTHPHTAEPRKSGGAGSSYVVEFKYQVVIAGQTLKLYFKGFFTENWLCKLEIQSLRDDGET